MVELVNAGLATVTAQHIVAGRNKHEVATLRITEAGRRMVEEQAVRREHGQSHS
jgi:hypothetical protein